MWILLILNRKYRWRVQTTTENDFTFPSCLPPSPCPCLLRLFYPRCPLVWILLLCHLKVINDKSFSRAGTYSSIFRYISRHYLPNIVYLLSINLYLFPLSVLLEAFLRWLLHYRGVWETGQILWQLPGRPSLRQTDTCSVSETRAQIEYRLTDSNLVILLVLWHWHQRGCDFSIFSRTVSRALWSWTGSK